MLSSTQALASLISLAFLLRPVLGHLKLAAVAAQLNSPGPRSRGFMLNLHGKYPWHMGQPGDAGGDAPYFSRVVEYVPNPKYPCGQLATLPNGIDIPSQLAQAEANGVATTASDGSFEALLFQVNRDGGGTCTCEYDTTATAQSWQNCKTLLNPPGIQGMWPNDRTNHTAKFQLPSSTVCRGGAFKDKCIVRIRCGFKLRFGGCVALKTPSSPKPLQLKIAGMASSATNNMNSMTTNIYNLLRAQGAIAVARNVKTSSKSSNKPRATEASSATNSASASLIDAVALQVIQMIQANNMRLIKQKTQMVAKNAGKTTRTS